MVCGYGTRAVVCANVCVILGVCDSNDSHHHALHPYGEVLYLYFHVCVCVFLCVCVDVCVFIRVRVFFMCWCTCLFLSPLLYVASLVMLLSVVLLCFVLPTVHTNVYTFMHMLVHSCTWSAT